MKALRAPSCTHMPGLKPHSQFELYLPFQLNMSVLGPERFLAKLLPFSLESSNMGCTESNALVLPLSILPVFYQAGNHSLTAILSI